MRIEQEVIQMEDSKKKGRKSRMKKRRKMEKQKIRKTLGKTSTMVYFSRIKWCQKKRGDTELECKTSVKHNSKFKTIHFKK